MNEPDRKESPPRPPTKSNGNTESQKPTDYAGMFLKIVAALAIIFATWIGNNFQRKMTAAKLFSEREQAESDLRAGMFNSLLASLVRPQDQTDIRREQLLTELLALNFDEHFELKPLLEYVDEELSLSKTLTNSEKVHARGSLRSVARRVIDRQLSLLLREEAPPVVSVQVFKALSEEQRDITYNTVRVGFEEQITMLSPSRRYRISIVPKNPDWENNTVDIELTVDQIRKPFSDQQDALTVSYYDSAALKFVTMANRPDDPEVTYEITDKKGQEANPDRHPRNFTLTSFDFPFTDNTLLGDGNRFALTLYKVERYDDEEIETSPPARSQETDSSDEKGRADRIADYSFMQLEMIWFPPHYYLPRERPINQTEYLHLVGVECCE